MRYFDLHCDTLYRAVTENKTLNENFYDEETAQKNVFSRGALFKESLMPPFQLSFDRGKKYSPWIQSMAIWIPDDVTEEYGERLFNKAFALLEKQCGEQRISLCKNFSDIKDVSQNNLWGAIFTLENGRLIKSLADVDRLKALGVRMITLTWNEENQIGCGVKAKTDKGLSGFGKEVLKKMESSGIIADVSHSSDKTFYDVAELSERPFVASHSNSRYVTENDRNITDSQFKIICQRGGLVGLNFCRNFLNSCPEKADASDVLRHAEHFLSLGGENCLTIGSDFDGTDMPKGISGIESIEELYELFLKHNYREELLDKLFFKNAYNFFENFDI